MKFQMRGDFQVTRAREDVFDFLSNPNRFAPLLPDFESVREVDRTHSVVSLGVGVAHIRGTATVRLERKEAERPRRAVYEGAGDVPGGTALLTASFELDDAGGGITAVRWTGEAQIAGRLPSLAGGLLEPMAKKNVQKLIDALRNALSQPAQSQPALETPAAHKEGSIA
jgi:carbon monoxide dehydrogenase subunit G